MAHNRLRLVRAFVRMNMAQAALKALKRLPAGSRLRAQGALEFAIAGSVTLPVAARMEALSGVSFENPWAALEAEEVRARAAFSKTVFSKEAGSGDTARQKAALGVAATLRFSAALLRLGSLDRAGAVVAPLAQGGGASASVQDRMEAIRKALAAQEWVAQARTLSDRGAHDRAAALYERAVTQLEASGDDHDTIAAEYWLLAGLLDRGEFETFGARYSVAKARSDRFGNPYQMLNVALLKARWQSMVGTPQAEKAWLGRALKVCRRYDNSPCEAVTYQRLAGVLGAEGRYGDAMRAVKLSLERFLPAGEVGPARSARLELAEQYRRLGRLDEAAREAEQVLRAASEAGAASDERTALMMLGAVAMRRGDAKTALARFGEVYELGTRTGDNWTRASALYFLALTHRSAFKLIGTIADLS